MNERRNGKKSRDSNGVSLRPVAAVVHDPSASKETGLPSWQTTVSMFYSQKKNGSKTFSKRDNALAKDSLFVIKRDDTRHIISENYYYKTEPYYPILQHELEGKKGGTHQQRSPRCVCDPHLPVTGGIRMNPGMRVGELLRHYCTVLPEMSRDQSTGQAGMCPFRYGILCICQGPAALQAAPRHRPRAPHFPAGRCNQTWY